MRSAARIAALALAASACGSSIGDAGDVDAATGGVDASSAADAGPMTDAAPPATAEVYPTDRTLSPITPFVAANLRAIAASGPDLADDVFAKVGASATVSSNFLHCFAGAAIDLDGRGELQATLDHFLAGDAGGTDPFTRTSLSATVGWSAGAALSGDPSPLDDEIAATSPRAAVIMYGTNDIQLGNIDQYGTHLMTLADLLMARGVVPLFTTIMPRDDDAAADAQVPDYNMIVRAVAQSRQVPLIDFHRELDPLADHGLSGDGIHPNVLRDPGAMACVFTPAPQGLAFGYNIRNLITLQTLHRVVDVLVRDQAAPDAPARTITGTGAPSEPVEIDALPFTDARDTTGWTHSNIDSYGGCAADQDESGPEYLYRLELAATTNLRARVVSRGAADIDIHLLGATADGASCIARDHRLVEATVDAGTYYLALDTFVAGGEQRSGEYLLIVTAQ